MHKARVQITGHTATHHPRPLGLLAFPSLELFKVLTKPSSGGHLVTISQHLTILALFYVNLWQKWLTGLKLLITV